MATAVENTSEGRGIIPDGREADDAAHVDIVGHEEVFVPVGAVGRVGEGDEVGWG